MRAIEYRVVASSIAIAACLGACALIEPHPIDAAGGPDAAPAFAAANAPVTREAMPGPVALAPDMMPAHTASAAPGPPAARREPPPIAVNTAAASAPESAQISASPPVPCPPGTIGMWSMPDASGDAVFICRQLAPRR